MKNLICIGLLFLAACSSPKVESNVQLQEPKVAEEIKNTETANVPVAVAYMKKLIASHVMPTMKNW